MTIEICGLIIGWASSRFMRTLHIIIGAALMVAFALGCSKDATPVPSVTFTGYKTGSDGIKRASFELDNPSKNFTAICHLQLEPGDVDEGMVSIPAGGSSATEILIRQAAVTGLKITAMRLTPVHQFSVSLP